MERHRSRFRNRFSLAVLATALCLATSLNPAPSDPAIPAPYDRPAEDDSAELRDLSHWMVSGGRSGSGRFQAIRPEDLAAAETPGSRELSLFEEPSAQDTVEAQRRFLLDLPYGTAISAAAERHRVDGLLLAAIVAVESGFTPEAVSPRGARGLMQIRPLVGEAYGARDLFDPYVNVDVGSRYFNSLMKDYEGNLELTLAAYNAGPAAVARYGGIPPYRETRAYVRKVTARYQEYTRRAGKSPGPLGS